MSQWYDLDALSYSPDNPNEGDIGGIYGSIKQHGYRDVVQVFGQQVKAGQHRLEALKWHLKEGYQATERDKCLRRGPEGQWQVEGLALDDMAPHQATAFMLAHNELTRRGHNDEAILAEVLAGLATEYEGETLAEATGYSAEALDDLLQDLAHEALQEGESEADRLSKADEYQAKWQVERGAIYRVGRHRLMCGDSTSQEDVQALMDGAKADMVWSDPPYGMNLDTDFSGMESKAFKGKTGGNYHHPIIGDNAPFDPAPIFNFFGYCNEIFLWGADYYAELLPNKNGGSWVVWDKRLDESADKMWGSTFELCWSKYPHKRDIARIKWAGIFGMETQDTDKRVHPTQKPTELAAWFITRWSKDNASIVDVYLGSGTTLVACEQTGRIGFGMEIHPPYVAVTLERLTALGLEAVRER